MSRNNARVYGKKKKPQESLDHAFANLDLAKSSPEISQEEETSRSRPPLQPISSNAGPEVAAAPETDSTKPKTFVRRTSEYKIHILDTPTPQTKKFEQVDPYEAAALDWGLPELTWLGHVKDKVHDFAHASRLWAENYNITKIAQGGFAAIFRLQLRSDPSKYVIAKLMPLKPEKGKGSRATDRTSIQDAATELKTLESMSETPGFVGFSEAWVLQGALPPLFKKEYQNWARTHPEDGFTAYPKDQLWCFIEMSDAGTDLEKVLANGFPVDESLHSSKPNKKLSAPQCWDIFWGIAEALGWGEEMAAFEHRDLHPGNVCIKETMPPPVRTAMSDPYISEFRERFTNIEVTLIDYTLSRCILPWGDVLANKMTDKSIFEQYIDNPCTQQEHNDNQQYRTYRQMRCLVAGDASGSRKEAKRWQNYVPQTNVLWLYHMLSILLQHLETDQDVTETRSSKIGQGNEVIVGHSKTDNEIEKLLKEILEGLNPAHMETPQWGSVTAFLQSERYWPEEARKKFTVVLEEEGGERYYNIKKREDL